MSDVPELPADFKEKKLDYLAVEIAREDIHWPRFRSSWVRISFGVVVGSACIWAGYDIFNHPDVLRDSIWFLFFFIMSFYGGYAGACQKKTKALLRLIEREAPALFEKISKDDGAKPPGLPK